MPITLFLRMIKKRALNVKMKYNELEGLTKPGSLGFRVYPV